MVSARFVRPALLLLSLPLALSAQDNDPPGRAGRVSSLLGTVAFQAAGSADWSTTPLNYTVTSGDRLLTYRRARAELEVGPFDVRLSDSTDLTVARLTDNFAQLELTQGTMRVSVYRLTRGDSMEVDTPNGAMIIRSAGHYRVDVLPGVSTIVTVEDGTIELSGPGLSQVLRRAQSVELTGASPILATLVQKPRQTDFDDWSYNRDRREETSDCSRYVSRDIPGCADLNDHGRWEQHAEYGYVWRPVVVTAGWVPYRSGRWVWTNTWGWTWVENTPWGFAPFHYGRWVTVGSVWVWAPGPVIRRPCYAPALVVFIRPDYGHYHQAWFPLGWREPYYPRYRHSDRYLREVNIANVRNVSNVDEFVDPRRAQRINYANRQATTVSAADAFGTRPVVHDASLRPDAIARAPITRERWEAPAVTTPTATPAVTTPTATSPRTEASPFGIRRRDAEPQPTSPEPPRVDTPTREPATEPASAAPLIRRNPVVGRRPDAPAPASPAAPINRSRPMETEPALPTPGERRPTVFRRADPDESRPPVARRPESDGRPVIARRPDAEAPPAPASVPEARRRGTIERAPEASTRPEPRNQASSPPAREAPKPQGSASTGAAAGRTASRTRPPG